jgi:hypothetical protein
MSGIARLTRDSGQLLGMEQPNVHPLPSAAAPPTRHGLFDQTLMVTDDISIDVLRVWARDAAAFADVLADQDPTWRSEWFPLAGGRVVLCGAGMYVNHALAVGLDGPLTEAAWRTFERRCAAVGVVPAFEVSPSTAGEVVAQLVDRGYALDGARAGDWVDEQRRRVDELIDDYRAALHDSLNDLTEEEARRRLVPSKTTLLGLVKHATFVEGCGSTRRSPVARTRSSGSPRPSTARSRCGGRPTRSRRSRPSTANGGRSRGGTSTDGRSTRSSTGAVHARCGRCSSKSCATLPLPSWRT